MMMHATVAQTSAAFSVFVLATPALMFSDYLLVLDQKLEISDSQSKKYDDQFIVYISYR
jgi:hypothetical protein